MTGNFDIGTRFKVYGWVMMKGINAGEIWEVVWKDQISYTLRRVLKNGRARGRTIRHRTSSIDCWAGGHPEDLNRLELIKGEAA